MQTKQVTKLSRSNSIVRAILDATFPKYSGRKIKAVQADEITFSNTNWDGGTHNAYIGIDLHNGEIAPVPAGTWYDPNNIEGYPVSIPSGCAVVEYSHFCGHEIGITIHYNGVLLPALVKGNAGLLRLPE